MEDFILENKGAYEPGVIVTSSDSQTTKIEEYLHTNNFESVTTFETLSKLLSSGGYFYLSYKNIHNPGILFEIITGFSSGSLQIEDEFISPNYKLITCILILSKDFLELEVEQGRNWLSLCGLTIQPE